MCFGPLKRVCHWGPLIALGIIKSITFSTVACLSQWWPPQESLGGKAVFVSFALSAVLTLYFFLQAMFTGPGALPRGWRPDKAADVKYLQYCGTCEGYKAPRAHHCRKCGQCVMKMDHHCPWINNCVGHRNHGSFTLFLLNAVLGCAQATVILAICIYHAIHRTWYLYYGTGREPIVYLSQWAIVACMFVLGLAIGVVLAVGMLLFFQVRAILRNRTGIEDWILEKAVHRRKNPEGEEDDPAFVYPYDLGRWKNFCQVLRPFREPAGDGIVWAVAEGCDQYTLTTEQLAQKAEKRARSRLYEIVEPFSGWWFPCTKGVCVCCHPPCTDEPRLPLRVGQEVVVTRWKRYWLYGERKTGSSTLPPPPPLSSSPPLPPSSHSSSSSSSSPPPPPSSSSSLSTSPPPPSSSSPPPPLPSSSSPPPPLPSSSSSSSSSLPSSSSPPSSSSSSATRHRGWFPRRCAVQVMYEGKKTR